MIKLAFVGNSESPAALLNLFRKMTPGNSGVWGRIRGVDNYKEADYYAVIDRTTADHGYLPKKHIESIEPGGSIILKKLIETGVVCDISNIQIKMNPGLTSKQDLVKQISGDLFKTVWANLIQIDKPFIIDESKCIFLGAHPRSISGAYADMTNLKCFKKYDCEEVFGFGEWWLSYNYDYLVNLQKPLKNKLVCSIVSNCDTYPNHKMRLAWLSRFIETSPNEYNLYGRIIPSSDKMRFYYRGNLTGKDHMVGKEKVLADHKYIIDFDNDCPDGHYFSERIFDNLLMWCMPIYWGGGNLHKYLPSESFRYLNINGNGEDVKEILDNNTYAKSIDAIAEARDILLNQLQIWPRVHQSIYGVCK